MVDGVQITNESEHEELARITNDGERMIVGNM
jgi:hypothetical protein